MGKTPELGDFCKNFFVLLFAHEEILWGIVSSVVHLDFSPQKVQKTESSLSSFPGQGSSTSEP